MGAGGGDQSCPFQRQEGKEDAHQSRSLFPCISVLSGVVVFFSSPCLDISGISRGLFFFPIEKNVVSSVLGMLSACVISFFSSAPPSPASSPRGGGVFETVQVSHLVSECTVCLWRFGFCMCCGGHPGLGQKGLAAPLFFMICFVNKTRIAVLDGGRTLLSFAGLTSE